MSPYAWHVFNTHTLGDPAFINIETGENSWDPPPVFAELTKEQMKQPKASDQVRASHLLVKHTGCWVPTDWKASNITLSGLSQEEAIAALRSYKSEINGSAQKFAELALAHSNCASRERGGDVGWFGPGLMLKPFEDAARALEIGEISDVITTESGVHLILRTG